MKMELKYLIFMLLKEIVKLRPPVLILVYFDLGISKHHCIDVALLQK